MLKGNLSTRPFYNERLLSLVVAIAVVAGVALTAFNAITITRLSSERSRQRAEQGRVESEATRMRASAAALKASVDRTNLRTLAIATDEANTLIDQRMFSWTDFFGLVEKTLPRDARLVAVAPRVDRGVFMIVMQLNIKRPEELERFIDALLGTGAFLDLLPSDQQLNDDGTQTATLNGRYLPPSGVAARVRPLKKGGGRP